MHEKYLSDDEFFSIYNRVPRLNVDLIIRSNKGEVMLGLRSIEPNEGMWSLPGGTVYKGERILEAAERIMKKETGLLFKFVKCLGYMDFPNEIRRGVNIHTISIAIEASSVGGEMCQDYSAKVLEYFSQIPENTVPEQANFFRINNIFSLNNSVI